MSYSGVKNSSRNADLVNYIENGKALNGTAGWNAYDDGNTAAAPVDGTGGSPQANLFVTSISSPLRGAVSFNLQKTGSASRQGQGVSYDFTIDNADLAKVLSVTFDYSVLSGTYADGDVTVYIIADPSGTPQVIQPAGYTVLAGTTGIKLRQIATFQTLSNVTSYRLCLHIASASTQDYTLALDTVRVGPQVVQYGAPVTDWQAISNVSAGTFITATTTNPTYGTIETNKAQFRRVGDSYEFHWDFKQTTSGTAGSGTYLINLPAGITIDTTKFSTGGADFQRVVGQVYLANATSVFEGFLIIQSSTQLYVSLQNSASTATNWGDAFGGFGNSVLRISANGLFPAAGLSSSVQMSNDTDTRVVAAFARKSSAQNIEKTLTTTITGYTTVSDSHSMLNASTGVVTIPVPGYYAIHASFAYSATVENGPIFSIVAGGNTVARADIRETINAFQVTSLSCAAVYLNAGDAVSVTAYHNATGTTGPSGTGVRALNADGNQNMLSIHRLSGPSAIAASETVAASYQTASGQTITNNNLAISIVNFNTRVFDTHNAVTTGSSWKFTAPVSGLYQITAATGSVSGGGWAAGEEWSNFIYVNDAVGVRLGSSFSQATHSTFVTAAGQTTVRLLAGEFLNIRIFQNSGANLNMVSDAAINHIEIIRVGN